MWIGKGARGTGRCPAGRALPVSRAGMEEEGVGMARKPGCPTVRQWFSRDARDGRGICRLGGKGADAQAPGGCFFCGNRVWGKAGEKAKDKHLARRACPAGTEDSSGAWDASDEQDIPVIPESRKRVLLGRPAPIPHERTGARRERPVRKDAKVLSVSFPYPA